MGVTDGGVDVVERLLHHSRRDVHLLAELVQVLKHGHQDTAAEGLQIPLGKFLKKSLVFRVVRITTILSLLPYK